MSQGMLIIEGPLDPQVISEIFIGHDEEIEIIFAWLDNNNFYSMKSWYLY